MLFVNDYHLLVKKSKAEVKKKTTNNYCTDCLICIGSRRISFNSGLCILMKIEHLASFFLTAFFVCVILQLFYYTTEMYINNFQIPIFFFIY